MLTEIELKILKEMNSDLAEPFEYIDNLVEEFLTQPAPQVTLELIFKLYKEGYLTICQIPLKVLGQGKRFAENDIVPKIPEDVVGDLKEAFQEYCKRRKKWNQSQASGLPFGIYISMTAKAKKLKES